ncbi:MAG: 50S ribosomal protein L11 methyltransferase [Verrucomicrobiales bacterium]
MSSNPDSQPLNPSSPSSQVFRWSKSVDDADVDWWETELTVEGVSFVSEKIANRKRWKFMVYDPTRELCEGLKTKFGGGVAEICDQEWKPAVDGEPGLIRVRSRLIVTESGEADFLKTLREENPDRDVLSFPPQLAFGTGFHPTTAGCLRLLVDATRDLPEGEWKTLDLGCGSGILAIAAEKLGSGEITAIEFDELALRVAIKNAELHDVDESKINFLGDDAVDWLDHSDFSKPEQKYEIVAANLFSSLLVAIMPNVPRCLAEGGTVILSGFLTSQTKEVFEAAQSVGIHLDKFLRRGKWIAAAGKMADS